MALGAMDIFKHLPAGAKLENANCKKCGSPTCMMFALKLAKKQAKIELCPYAPSVLVEKINEGNKIQQKEVKVDDKIFGGENVMYRHQKTFKNPTGIVVELDCEEFGEFSEKFKRLSNFEIESIGEKFKIDGIYLKNSTPEAEKTVKEAGFAFFNEKTLEEFQIVDIQNKSVPEIIKTLTHIRQKAIVERDEKFSNPTCVFLEEKNPKILSAIASTLICKYASIIIFKEFDEAVFTTLITLRQNIFTDPEKPLQVESRVYEFNNPDENALVFLTTNFALTYFAVANELSSLKRSSFLVVTPSEGMSVLTAWSAEKITAKIAKKIVENNDILNSVKIKKIIIPGLLADLKTDLEEALEGWEIIIGTTEAYKIPDMIKNLNW